MICTGHPTVDSISQLHFQGNIVQHSWYRHIRYENKRGWFTCHLSCLILADLIFWYRPQEIRDEHSGHIIGHKKKFSGSILQKSPTDMAELLGCSAKVARESFALLEKLGLIAIDVKPQKTSYGFMPNVLCVDLVVDAIANITYSVTKLKPETVAEQDFPPCYPNGQVLVTHFGTPCYPFG